MSEHMLAYPRPYMVFMAKMLVAIPIPIPYLDMIYSKRFLLEREGKMDKGLDIVSGYTVFLPNSPEFAYNRSGYLRGVF